MASSKLIAFLFVLTFSLTVWGEEYQLPRPEPEAKQEVRNGAVVEKLAGVENTIAVYAKGLCCPSCAIGVRKSIGKMDFVDRSRFKKGIDLDAKMQVATVAVKEGVAVDSIDRDAVAAAVDDAGYDPVHFYSMVDGVLRTEVLSVKE